MPDSRAMQILIGKSAFFGVIFVAACLTSVQADGSPVPVNNKKYLKELHESFLELFNKERDTYSLTHVTMDPTLTDESQQWADESAQNLRSASSCENQEFGECANFTEVYAMRRATRSKQPVGKACSEWLWKTWFSNPDSNADQTPIPQNVLINIMGLGVSYVTAPDKSNHVYAVARFAEVDPDTYFQDKKLHEIIYFPDEVDITKTYKDTYKKPEGAEKGRSIGRSSRRHSRRRNDRRKHYQTKSSDEEEKEKSDEGASDE